MVKHVIVLSVLLIIFAALTSYVLSRGEYFTVIIPLPRVNLVYRVPSILLSEIFLMIYIIVSSAYTVSVAAHLVESYAVSEDEANEIAERAAEMRVSYLRDQIKALDRRTSRNLSEINKLKEDLDLIKKALGIIE